MSLDNTATEQYVEQARRELNNLAGAKKLVQATVEEIMRQQDAKELNSMVKEFVTIYKQYLLSSHSNNAEGDVRLLENQLASSKVYKIEFYKKVIATNTLCVFLLRAASGNEVIDKEPFIELLKESIREEDDYPALTMKYALLEAVISETEAYFENGERIPTLPEIELTPAFINTLHGIKAQVDAVMAEKF